MARYSRHTGDPVVDRFVDAEGPGFFEIVFDLPLTWSPLPSIFWKLLLKLPVYIAIHVIDHVLINWLTAIGKVHVFINLCPCIFIIIVHSGNTMTKCDACCIVVVSALSIVDVVHAFLVLHVLTVATVTSYSSFNNSTLLSYLRPGWTEVFYLF